MLPISRRRHRDDLPEVRRVGQDLLVAGHRRREDRLAGRRAARAEGAPVEDGAVGEDEPGAVLLVGSVIAISSMVVLERRIGPRTMVICDAPRHLAPGERRVLALRCEAAPGRSSTGASGSTRTRSAARPFADARRREADDPGRRARERVDEARERERARRARAPRRSGTHSSSPIIPGAASASSQSFSRMPWGAWSVAMQSIVPSARARARARRRPPARAAAGSPCTRCRSRGAPRR